MSSYSKKYTNFKDDQKHLFLTWETGYKNLRVYYDSQLIQTIASPGGFRKGVSFDHPELKKVELKFSSGAPIIMQVKADGQKYYPENNKAKAQKNDLSGLVYLFGVLSFLAALGTLITQNALDFQIENPFIFFQLIFDLTIVSIYTISAIFLYRNKSWAYYLGGITFTLTSIIYVYSISLIGIGFTVSFVVLIKIAIIVYIARQFNEVMRITKKTVEINPDLLDNSDF